MNLNDSMKKAIDIIKLDEKAIGSVSKDKDAWKIGLLIVIIGGIFSGISAYNLDQTGSLDTMDMIEVGDITLTSSIINGAIGSIVGTFIGAGLVFLFAKLFKGKGKYMELFTPIAFISILSWLTILNIIPTLGNIINLAAGIWSIVVLVIIVRKVCDLTTGKAAAVVIIPLALFIILGVILGVVATVLLGPEMMLA